MYITNIYVLCGLILVQLCANYENCSVSMHHPGINASIVNGKPLNKGETRQEQINDECDIELAGAVKCKVTFISDDDDDADFNNSDAPGTKANNKLNNLPTTLDSNKKARKATKHTNVSLDNDSDKDWLQTNVKRAKRESEEDNIEDEESLHEQEVAKKLAQLQQKALTHKVVDEDVELKPVTDSAAVQPFASLLPSKFDQWTWIENSLLVYTTAGVICRNKVS